MRWTLGIHGGVNTRDRFRLPTPKNWMHDAAAVLCCDGKIIAAAEEERFVRIKHVNYFPLEAIRTCLSVAGIRLNEVDYIGLSSRHMEQFNHFVNDWELGSLSSFSPNYIDYVAELLTEAFGPFERSALDYVGHHLSHTLSAVCMAGFDDCLCLVLDGWGDGLTGQISAVRDGSLKTLEELSDRGPAALYLRVTQLLGYDQFDEYKVMGLAPYGNPERFRQYFDDIVELMDDGRFRIGTPPIPDVAGFPRKKGEPFADVHRDFAAALQRATERLLIHVLEYQAQRTNLRNLCLAGGVAQNCSANGVILASGLFDRVFVQPVSYDAGCALGSALAGQLAAAPEVSIRGIQTLEHLYYGTPLEPVNELEAIVESWSGIVDVQRLDDPSDTAAELLARGEVLGWVQGSAEFGARALGNRSILADPRPRENMDRINAMVKKREGFRPFAPAVLEEYLHEYFDVQSSINKLPYMVFVVGVALKYREHLGAVTHVDGSARVQSVSRDTNCRFWELIEAFRQRTGTPLVLNTSFNNHAEPIVNTAQEAINCFLSTEIDALIVGDFLLRKPVDVLRRLIEQRPPKLTSRFLLAFSDRGTHILDRHTSKTLSVRPSVAQRLSVCAMQGSPLRQMESADLLEIKRLWDNRAISF